MKDLATQYFEELARKADTPSNPHRVPITLRVHPYVLERLERLAKELDKSRAEVGADVLTEGSEEVAIHLARELQMTDEDAMEFVHGVPKQEGDE